LKWFLHIKILNYFGMKEISYTGILILAAILLQTGYDAIGNDPCRNIAHVVEIACDDQQSGA
jgi:hypothetical protein